MKNDTKTIIETSLAFTGLTSFRDLSAIALIARKLLLKRQMHANMIYYSYLRFQSSERKNIWIAPKNPETL